LRSVRGARLETQLDRLSPTDAAAPLLLEEWLRLTARDGEGRVRARTRIRDFPRQAMHVELLLLAGSVLYAEGDAAEAALYFREAEAKTADRMVRRDIEEWLARCRFLLQDEHVQ
ncbi:MAG: hypothetical protein RRA94_16155, partial [Bacteroidota bacterium]|nr:hypothetical protein [Bacteroidota bacterium]